MGVQANLLIVLAVIYGCFLGYGESKVTAKISGLDLVISNDHFTAHFESGAGKSLTVNGKNIAKTFFIDATDKKYRKFSPNTLEVVSESNDLVHVNYANHPNNGLMQVELHLVVTSDVSGIYQYVVIKNTYKEEIEQEEIRMTWRMDPKILNKVSNGLFTEEPPSSSTIEKSTNVWDATWKLSDGTYYSKYDFARYVRETSYYGVLGNGYGTWVILPDHEYFSGGPLKQDLMSHQWGLVLMYMTGRHFGTPTLKMEKGFEKLYGPWLIYFNHGGSDSQLEQDAKNQAEKEVAKWPYSFIKDSRYPLSRGTASGTIKGKKAMVFLQPPNEECELQTHGYVYHTTTVNQKWTIKNIRPGSYMLCAYPLEGASVGTMLNKTLTITANHNTDGGTLQINEPSGIIWQLGEANHRSSEFKYSNEKRNWGWHLMSPQNLNFVIGKSNPANDWYYAQTQKGTWKIEFTDTHDGKNRSVWIGMAAASYTPQTKVSVNGHSIGNLGSYENDAAIYRCALQSGDYHYAKLSIPASEVISGTNTLSIELDSGMVMYDTIVYLRN